MYYKTEESLLNELNELLELYQHNTEENRKGVVNLAKEFYQFDLDEKYAVSASLFLFGWIRDKLGLLSIDEVRKGLLLELDRHRLVESKKISTGDIFNVPYVKGMVNIKSLRNGKTIKKARGKSGIYYLYDKDKTIIYIGKSVNLVNRIYESARQINAKYCKYSIINNKSDMSIFEAYLIAKYKPKYNKDHNFPEIITIEIKEPDKCDEYIEIIRHRTSLNKLLK